MKPEIKKLWIDALLSGEYEQGRGVLCRADDGKKEWCCLGVLTDLAIKAGIVMEIKMSDDPSNPYTVFFDDAHEKLPVKVQEWSGIETDLGEYSYEDINIDDEDIFIAGTLAEDNDNGTTFEQLVSIIESYF